MELLFSRITLDIIVPLVIIVYSAILHEIAHGYVADRLGDPTARLMGRLTLNPIPHIDPFLSIGLPLILIFTSPIIFGGAKPVPVDMFNLRDGRKDMALVSLAGPLTNVLIAVVAAILLRLFFDNANAVTESFSGFITIVLISIMKINVLLAIFNLLPIPPLDGSKVFSLILPHKEANAYLSLGSIGMFILFFLLMFPIGPFSLQRFIGATSSSFLTLLGF